MNLPLFGPLLGIGFLAGSFYLWKRARASGFNEEKVIDLMLLTTFVSLTCARMFYILFHFSNFGLDAGRWLLFTKYPGMEFAGAVFGAVTALLLFGGGWVTLDLFALPVILFTITGTAGCYFNKCYAGPNFTPIIIFSVYILLFVILSYVEKKVKTTPEWAELISKPGFIACGYFLVTIVIQVVLEKNNNVTLYFLWLVALGLTATLFAVRYRRLLKEMIKFPPNVLVQIRTYLEQRKAQTEHKLEDLKKEDPFEGNGHAILAADDEEANEKASHERTQALVSQMTTILIQTRKALTKIKIGSYGTCEKCGKMIDTDRLAAMPTATLCLSCEKKKEK